MGALQAQTLRAERAGRRRGTGRRSDRTRASRPTRRWYGDDRPATRPPAPGRRSPEGQRPGSAPDRRDLAAGQRRRRRVSLPTPKSTVVIHANECRGGYTPNPRRPAHHRTSGMTTSVLAARNRRCSAPVADEKTARRAASPVKCAASSKAVASRTDGSPPRARSRAVASMSRSAIFKVR